jgi:hypothetical protein
MIALKAFDNKSVITLSADITLLQPDLLELRYVWVDKENKIILPESPAGGRHTGLWNHTCFEAFVKPEGKGSYYEINLSVTKAWNVFSFESYREPQPPREFVGAVVQDILVKPGYLSAQVKLGGVKLEKIKASLCAVLEQREAGVSYWAHNHADQKPNFHHLSSLTIERSLT